MGRRLHAVCAALTVLFGAASAEAASIVSVDIEWPTEAGTPLGVGTRFVVRAVVQDLSPNAEDAVVFYLIRGDDPTQVVADRVGPNLEADIEASHSVSNLVSEVGTVFTAGGTNFVAAKAVRGAAPVTPEALVFTGDADSVTIRSGKSSAFTIYKWYGRIDATSGSVADVTAAFLAVDVSPFGPPSWSGVKRSVGLVFAIDTSVPGPPQPAPVTVPPGVEPAPLQLSWSAASLADSYELDVGRAPGCDDIHDDLAVAGLSLQLAQPLGSTPYCWRIRSVTDDGFRSLYSQDQTFTPFHSPVAVALGGTHRRPALIWRSVATAVAYQLDFGATPTCQDILAAASLADTTYTPALPLFDGDYCWRVRAVHADGAVSGDPATQSLQVPDVVEPLAFAAQPGPIVSGAPFDVQPVVVIPDRAGEPDSFYSGVVSLRVVSGAGALTGTTTVAAVGGVATFSEVGYVAGVDGEAVTLQATATPVEPDGPDLGPAPATSDPVNADVVAERLAFITQPRGVITGQPLQVQPVVAALGPGSVIDTDFTETVTLSGVPISGTGQLTGTTSATAVAGQAAFVDVGWDFGNAGDTALFTADDDAALGTDLPAATSNLLGVPTPPRVLSVVIDTPAGDGAAVGIDSAFTVNVRVLDSPPTSDLQVILYLAAGADGTPPGAVVADADHDDALFDSQSPAWAVSHALGDIALTDAASGAPLGSGFVVAHQRFGNTPDQLTGDGDAIVVSASQDTVTFVWHGRVHPSSGTVAGVRAAAFAVRRRGPPGAQDTSTVVLSSAAHRFTVDGDRPAEAAAIVSAGAPRGVRLDGATDDGFLLAAQEDGAPAHLVTGLAEQAPAAPILGIGDTLQLGVKLGPLADGVLVHDTLRVVAELFDRVFPVGTADRSLDTLWLRHAIVEGDYGDVVGARNALGLTDTARVFVVDHAGNRSGVSDAAAGGLETGVRFYVDGTPPAFLFPRGFVVPADGDTITDGGLHSGFPSDRHPLSYRLPEALDTLRVTFTGDGSATTLRIANGGWLGGGGQKSMTDPALPSDSTRTLDFEDIGAANPGFAIGADGVLRASYDARGIDGDPLTTGVHVIELQARDLAGNLGPPLTRSGVHVDVDDSRVLGRLPSATWNDTLEESMARVTLRLSEVADSVAILYKGIAGLDNGSTRSRSLVAAELLKTTSHQTFVVASLVTSTHYTLQILTRDPTGNYHLTAPDTFYYDTNYVCCGAEEVSISLVEGFNLVSWNVLHPHPFWEQPMPMAQRVDPLVQRGTLERIFGYETTVLNPNPPAGAKQFDPAVDPALNDLQLVDIHLGYWFEMSAADTLTVWGSQAPRGPVPLAAGFNLVSYLPQTPDSTAAALRSLPGLVRAYGYETAVSSPNGTPGAKQFDPTVNPLFNDLRFMAPTLGYWLEMAQPDTLTYPPPSLPAGRPVALRPQTVVADAGPVRPTRRWIDVYGDLHLEGRPAPVGTVVDVVDTDGTVAGWTTVRAAGRYGFLHIYADEPATPLDEGADPGQWLAIRVDGQPTGQTVQWTTFGASTRIDLEAATTAPRRFALHPSYPNPFNPATTLRFEVATAGPVSLRVYNLAGQLVRVLIDEPLPAAAHAVAWDGTDAARRPVASGVYFGELRSGTQRAVRRMLLLK